MKISKKELNFGLEVKHIHFGMFDYPVVVVIGNRKKLQSYVRWKHDSPKFKIFTSVCGSRATTFRTPGYIDIIWLPKRPKSPEEIATVAHESLHVVQGLFDWVGMDMDEPTQEVAAHALGFLVKEILDWKK